MTATRTPDPNHATSAPRGPRAGFTLVEVIISVVILACGLLAMAGTTALVVRQVTLADLATERSAALQSAIERIRALPFDDVAASADSTGIFAVRWSVTSSTPQSKSVRVVITGPGMSTDAAGLPVLSATKTDTVDYRLIGP